MHSLLIQLLIAHLDREFSTEEFKQLLEEVHQELGYSGMLPYYEISNRLQQEKEVLRVRLGHPTSKVLMREVVKGVVSQEAARANEPRLPIPQHPEDETPVDWQPRSVSVKIV